MADDSGLNYGTTKGISRTCYAVLTSDQMSDSQSSYGKTTGAVVGRDSGNIRYRPYLYVTNTSSYYVRLAWRCKFRVWNWTELPDDEQWTEYEEWTEEYTSTGYTELSNTTSGYYKIHCGTHSIGDYDACKVQVRTWLITSKAASYGDYTDKELTLFYVPKPHIDATAYLDGHIDLSLTFENDFGGGDYSIENSVWTYTDRIVQSKLNVVGDGVDENDIIQNRVPVSEYFYTDEYTLNLSYGFDIMNLGDGQNLLATMQITTDDGAFFDFSSSSGSSSYFVKFKMKACENFGVYPELLYLEEREQGLWHLVSWCGSSTEIEDLAITVSALFTWEGGSEIVEMTYNTETGEWECDFMPPLNTDVNVTLIQSATEGQVTGQWANDCGIFRLDFAGFMLNSDNGDYIYLNLEATESISVSNSVETFTLESGKIISRYGSIGETSISLNGEIFDASVSDLTQWLPEMKAMSDSCDWLYRSVNGDKRKTSISTFTLDQKHPLSNAFSVSISMTEVTYGLDS